MNLEEKALNILLNHAICDYCLGRQFSNLGTGTTNLYRGQTIKTYLAMNLSSSLSEENIQKLQILSQSGSVMAKNILRKENISPDNTQKCYICENYLDRANELVELIIPKLKDYEFRTILVGTSLPKEFHERELKNKENFDTISSEYLKQEFNRIIGKKLANKIALETDFKSPDIVIEVEPLTSSFKLRIKPLYIFGRYLKYLRTIPQTRWPCRNCKGKGCKECSNTGRRYAESVEELVEIEALNHTKGKKVTLHGAGREDIDALMLGSGRPFVMEVIAPKVRSINIKELEESTNKSTKEKIEVREYRWSSKKEIIHLKSSAKDSIKKYRALIEYDKSVSGKELRILEKEFNNRMIKQRTPDRVSHRRADKIREKEVHSIQSKKIDDHEIELIIECEGGCYVKELISGDNNRTIPSVSEVIGIQAICKELDVLEIRDKPFV